MDEKALGASAQSWSRFKRSLDRWSIAYLDSVQTPIDVLVNRLLNETVSDPIDFCGDFRIYLAVRLPAWQNDYHRLKVKGNTGDLEDFLNRPFGVYWELTWQPKATDKKQRLTLLRQWAANGSREGVDEYQKILSDDYVMQGQYALAIACQQLRRKNFESESDDYWRQRHIGEVDTEIDAINSRWVLSTDA